LLFVLPLSGCGPSREQILFYELELAVVSFALTWFLMWLGRRFIESRVWFVCSYCLQADGRFDARDGTMATCPHCGQLTSVNELPPAIRREMILKGRTGWRRILRRVFTRPLAAAAVLAVGFQILLILAGLGVVWLFRMDYIAFPGFEHYTLRHEVTFPLVFGLAPGEDELWPCWVYNWIFLLSFHAGVSGLRGFDSLLSPFTVPLPQAAGWVIVTVGQLFLWSLVIWLGHRLRSRRWLPPMIMGGVNALIAVLAYRLDWSI
jgi:hypothetical protein